MKKIISVLILSIVFITGLTGKENPVSFSAGLSTGIPFYGSKETDRINKSLENPGRFIIGAYGNINFNIIEQGTLFLGADLLSDFIWNNDYHSNHIHFSMPVGFKIYPNLQGLCFGIAYTLGFRADFIDTVDVYKKEIPCWGNGFKLFTEYNFAKYGKSKYLPIIGFSWNLMPRGGNAYDNIINFYVGANF